jgi:hypothetical protein
MCIRNESRDYYYRIVFSAPVIYAAPFSFTFALVQFFSATLHFKKYFILKMEEEKQKKEPKSRNLTPEYCRS